MARSEADLRSLYGSCAMTISVRFAATRSDHTELMQTHVRRVAECVGIEPERQGREVTQGQTNCGQAADYSRMAIDAIMRARDGIESGLIGYSLEQVTRASYYLSEAAFRLQTQILVEAKDFEIVNDKKGKEPCPEPNHVRTKPATSGSASVTSSPSAKEHATSVADVNVVEKSSKCPSADPATRMPGAGS
jgi:hypothetical protein